MSVADVAGELFVGLGPSAEIEPAREELKHRAGSALILSLIVAVQLVWWFAFGYAAYLFLLN